MTTKPNPELIERVAEMIWEHYNPPYTWQAVYDGHSEQYKAFTDLAKAIVHLVKEGHDKK